MKKLYKRFVYLKRNRKKQFLWSAISIILFTAVLIFYPDPLEWKLKTVISHKELYHKHLHIISDFGVDAAPFLISQLGNHKKAFSILYPRSKDHLGMPLMGGYEKVYVQKICFEALQEMFTQNPNLRSDRRIVKALNKMINRQYPWYAPERLLPGNSFDFFATLTFWFYSQHFDGRMRLFYYIAELKIPDTKISLENQLQWMSKKGEDWHWIPGRELTRPLFIGLGNVGDTATITQLLQSLYDIEQQCYSGQVIDALRTLTQKFPQRILQEMKQVRAEKNLLELSQLMPLLCSVENDVFSDELNSIFRDSSLNNNLRESAFAVLLTIISSTDRSLLEQEIRLDTSLSNQKRLLKLLRLKNNRK